MLCLRLYSVSKFNEFNSNFDNWPHVSFFFYSTRSQEYGTTSQIFWVATLEEVQQIQDASPQYML